MTLLKFLGGCTLAVFAFRAACWACVYDRVPWQAIFFLR